MHPEQPKRLRPKRLRTVKQILDNCYGLVMCLTA